MFRPLLAADAIIDKLQFPLLASPKIDGIRCVIVDGQPLTRSLKQIPNKYITSQLMGLPPYDGELVVGDCFSTTTSAVMSIQGNPDFKYFIFDFVDVAKPFKERLLLIDVKGDRLVKLEHIIISSIAELIEYEEKAVRMGYEGVMLRDPDGRYKYGRSTVNEGILLKLKRFVDEEAMIIDLVEKMHNLNEVTLDERGYSKRSSVLANMQPMNTLGALVVNSQRWGVFKVGSGFTDEQRNEVWVNASKYIGATITFKYFPHGVKDKPRSPIFKGFRVD